MVKYFPHLGGKAAARYLNGAACPAAAIKELFGKGRLLVNATFDGVPYSGQVVKMGTPHYIIGVTKKIRSTIGKSFGDEVDVTIRER